MRAVLVAAALAPVFGLPLEIHDDVIALPGGAVLDRVEAGGFLAETVQLLVHVLVADAWTLDGDAEALPVGQLDEGQDLEDGAERHGRALFDLQLLDLRRGERLEAAALELVEDDLVDESFGGLGEDLALEAVLDDRRRGLSGAEAGEAGLLCQVLGAAVDLGLDELLVDLESKGLPDRSLLDVVDFQGIPLCDRGSHEPPTKGTDAP